MSRRSVRLIEKGYYTEERTPSISYKEILRRNFRRRRARARGHESANSVRQPAELDTAIWTPDARTHLTSTTVARTRGNMIGSFSLKNFSTFLLFLLVAFGYAHMYFQLAQVQQEVQSLTQRRDMLTPWADTIANFALKSQGARVLHHLSSDTYCPQKHTGFLWDTIFYRLWSSSVQKIVIRGHSPLRPGQCWCFSGESGHLFISLSHQISITHVTVGHISKSQSPSGNIESAPRVFSVYGMRTEAEEGTFLGRLAYNQDGAVFQTLELPNPGGVFKYVKLQVEKNWGNIDYTCLYNFRVHGKLPA